MGICSLRRRYAAFTLASEKGGSIVFPESRSERGVIRGLHRQRRTTCAQVQGNLLPETGTDAQPSAVRDVQKAACPKAARTPAETLTCTYICTYYNSLCLNGTKRRPKRINPSTVSHSPVHLRSSKIPVP